MFIFNPQTENEFLLTVTYFPSFYNDLIWPVKRLKSLDFCLSSTAHIKFPLLEEVYMLILPILAHQAKHFQLKTFLLKA